MELTGLVLSGGGARAAYQVGALRALAEVLRPEKRPFRVVSGLSAGAINGAVLAAGADNFQEAVTRLEAIWLGLSPDSVYRTDVPSLATIGMRWMGTVAGGGAKRKLANHLLDTQPLREFLTREVDVARIPEHIRGGHLRAFATSATNYATGTAVTFFDGAGEITPWLRSTRLGKREAITIDHLMASSAIPIFFPPVPLDGTFFGDGCVRLTTPLSPAIHLGAEKLIAISVRYLRSGEETADLNALAREETPTLAEIAGALLNAVFLDSLDADVERLQRVNRTLSSIPQGTGSGPPEGLRRIPALLLGPSQDLGLLASELDVRWPGFLRYLLRGLGARGARGSNLLSYLAFQRQYVEKLIHLGYNDTIARADEIRVFTSG